MGKSFIEGIKTPFESAVAVRVVRSKDGSQALGVVHWARAVALAGDPDMEVVGRGSDILHPVFGGAAVAVAQDVCGKSQLTWLPVMDQSKNPIAWDDITSADACNSVARCRAKSAAMVNGVALPLNCMPRVAVEDERAPVVLPRVGVDVVAFLQQLGVKPGDDLAKVQPVISSSPKKNGEWLQWGHALAACRITDPAFLWSVDTFETVDTGTGEVITRPYFQLGSTYAVSVTVTYHGRTHTETRAILGIGPFKKANGQVINKDHQPIAKPTSKDWNTTVMRCLTKAIALVSGYGLNAYARADVEDMDVAPLQKRPAAQTANTGASGPAEPGSAAPEGTTAAPAAAASAPVGPGVPAAPPVDVQAHKAALIEHVSLLLVECHRTPEKMLEWLHVGGSDLGAASVEQLEAGVLALEGVQAVPVPTAAPAPAPAIANAA